MRRHYGRSLSSSLSGVVFSAIRCRNSQIVRQSKTQRPICPSPSSWRLPPPLWPTEQYTSSSKQVRRWSVLFQPFLGLQFVDGHETILKLLQITASERSLISLCDFSSKNKNRITDIGCSLSVFLQTADMNSSTWGATGSIRVNFWTSMYYTIANVSCNSGVVGW